MSKQKPLNPKLINEMDKITLNNQEILYFRDLLRLEYMFQISDRLVREGTTKQRYIGILSIVDLYRDLDDTLLDFKAILDMEKLAEQEFEISYHTLYFMNILTSETIKLPGLPKAIEPLVASLNENLGNKVDNSLSRIVASAPPPSTDPQQLNIFNNKASA